jgi:hypothetical protein
MVKMHSKGKRTTKVAKSENHLNDGINIKQAATKQSSQISEFVSENETAGSG